MAKNKTLNTAKAAKKDEFYTQLHDIEAELRHYWPHFTGKTILCNCDDPYESNFFKYFALNFNLLKLKRLIATCYDGSVIGGTQMELFDDDRETKFPASCEKVTNHSKTRVPHKIVINELGDFNGDGSEDLRDIVYSLRQNKQNTLTRLEGNGDFRSAECVALLKEADIVVTNPPFSLFREYVAQLVEHHKKFLIIGHQNALKYREIFPLIQSNQMWLGFGFKGNATHFYSSYKDIATAGNHRAGMIRVSGVTWFTNLDHKKRHEEMILFKKYKPELYPHYTNFEAIDVPKVSELPCDYDGLMGVPITFLEKFNPDQFEIVGNTSDGEWLKCAGAKPMGAETISNLRAQGNMAHVTANMCSLYYVQNGKVIMPYARLIIRNKHPQEGV